MLDVFNGLTNAGCSKGVYDAIISPATPAQDRKSCLGERRCGCNWSSRKGEVEERNEFEAGRRY